MSASFEVVSKFADQGINLPIRKTAESAGYDFCVAEDTIIPPWSYLYNELVNHVAYHLATDGKKEEEELMEPRSLADMAAITKSSMAKVTLVPTGVKCKLDPGTYLELSTRSSLPLKHWLMLANGVGIVDADYYNNPDNEGHIYFQLVNFSPFPIILHKGDAIGQGIIKHYDKVENDNATAERVGGFGSTNG